MIESTSTSPLIVIGMHRSGTTLLTRMLEICGVFWGINKDEYNEAKSFQTLNEKLFAIADCEWDSPDPVAKHFADPQLAGEAEAFIRRSLHFDFIRFYLGWRCRLSDYYKQWGWKDPRNTFTLPVWLRVFPRARVVHILRNGVDVTASLWKRETSRPEGSNHPHYSPRCQNLDGCFSLWKSYVMRARHHLSKLENAVEIRFEDLVERPESTLRFLADFVGLESEGCLSRAVSMIHPERRFSFVNDQTLLRFWQTVEDDALLAELGYSPLT